MRHLLSALMLLLSAPLFAQEDCDVFNIQELSAAYLNVSVDSTILQSDGSYAVYLSNGTTYTQVQGCTNPAYTEYSASANTDDGSCATSVVEGCLDPAYVEYSASANTDDGSCVTLVVEGCTDAADANYDPAANTDDGSCASCSSIEFDDYTYSVVQIGDQCWFAENLRATVYADDSSIPEVTDNSAWEGLSTGARCDYNNTGYLDYSLGRLYNWFAVTNVAGLCPNGWHVPTDGEWTALEDYIIAQGFNEPGRALKSTSGWYYDGHGTDNFGFSARPGGYRTGYGVFDYVWEFGFWWSSSPSGGSAWYRSLDYLSLSTYRGSANPLTGFSVRCLRTLIVNGCTDPAYVEYSASANTDDGSCATLIVNGDAD